PPSEKESGVTLRTPITIPRFVSSRRSPQILQQVVYMIVQTNIARRLFDSRPPFRNIRFQSCRFLRWSGEMTSDADLKAQILALLRRPKYRPLDRKELTRALGLGGDDRREVREALRDLEHAGEIARIRKNRY